MPETPRPRGAHSWDRWPPGQGGSGTRDPSLNKQVEVMSQPLHHLEFPELRFWEERKEESTGRGWFGPNSNKLLCFWGVRVVPAPASSLKGHGISGNPHPHPRSGPGSQRPPVTHRVAGKPLRPWRKAKLPSAMRFLPGQERGLGPAPPVAKAL